MPTNSNTGTHPRGLRRDLGLLTATLMVAGIMIGSGVFKKIVPMSQIMMDEFGIILAWIVAGLISMMGAFTYAAMAGLTDESGGVYEYLRISVGGFPAYLFGWMIFTIGGSGAIAALAFVFAQSLHTLIPIPDLLPAEYSADTGQLIRPLASSGIKLVAILTIILLTWISYRGVRKSGILNNIITVAKVLGILVLIVAGLMFRGASDKEEVQAAAMHFTGWLPYLSAFFGALLSVLWAYDGWANITYISGEIRNPRRNVPWAIMLGIGIAMILYVLVNTVYMRVLPLPLLASMDENQIAAAEVAGVMMGPAGSSTVSLLILISVLGALNACIIVYPRLYFRMAEQGVFFSKAASIHPRYHTPHLSMFLSSAWSCVLVVSGTFDLLTNLVIFTGFLFFGLVALGLFRLKRKGIITRKIFAYPLAPAFIIVFSLVLVIHTFTTQPLASLLGLALVGSGIPVYFLFKRKSGPQPGP